MSYIPATQSAPRPASPASKILTIIGAAVALLLLVVSVMLGFGSHSHKQQAAQAAEEAQSLRNQTRDVETEIATVHTQTTQATNKKEATAWCDGFTSSDSSPDAIDKKARALLSTPQPRKDAIAEVCPKKKEFAEAFAKDATGKVVDTDFSCTSDGSTVTVSGTATVAGPTLASLGSFDVRIGIVVTSGAETSGVAPSDTVSLTIPQGGSAPFSSTVPAPSSSSGRCAVRTLGLWPSGV